MRSSASAWSIVISGGKRRSVGPGRLEPVAERLAGVGVAAVEQLAELVVIERGVEVAGSTRSGPRAAAGRSPRSADQALDETVGGVVCTALVMSGGAPGTSSRAVTRGKPPPAGGRSPGRAGSGCRGQCPASRRRVPARGEEAVDPVPRRRAGERGPRSAPRPRARRRRARAPAPPAARAWPRRASCSPPSPGGSARPLPRPRSARRTRAAGRPWRARLPPPPRRPPRSSCAARARARAGCTAVSATYGVNAIKRHHRRRGVQPEQADRRPDGPGSDQRPAGDRPEPTARRRAQAPHGY